LSYLCLFCCHSRRESAVVLALVALLKGTASVVPKPAKGPTARPEIVEGLERSPKGEATESIAFAAAYFYFFYFQPKIRMSSPKTT
jgi:hypothetical protein